MKFPELWTKMQRYGRRNISWSTVAPNGSLSLLAQLDDNHFGTTSGVEPLFKVYHIRRKKINPNDKNARVDFVDDLGDKWQEFGVFHEGFKMWYDINCPDGKSITELTKDEIDEFVKKSPYYNSSAEEINWVKRIEIQAIIQKYITHSISSTINLPENISVDEVSKIYFEAWKKGLKGITIYRSGSRSGVLIEKKDNSLVEKEQFSYYDAPKRPKEIDGELHIVSVKGQKYCVLIGFFDNKPYELFAFIASEDIIKEGNSKGKIVKVKRGHYNYYSGDNKLRHVEFAASTPSEQVFTRLISGMLRHGVNPEYIIEQIDKCPLEIVSFGKAISRILKKYIKLTRNQDEKWCENDCKIVHEEGCAKCLTCGQSICK